MLFLRNKNSREKIGVPLKMISMKQHKANRWFVFLFAIVNLVRAFGLIAFSVRELTHCHA